MSFLTTDKTIRRKVQELVLATRLEESFSKQQILELYLNKAYFGDGLYGVEAASLGYFGKHAADLDVAEAALIAGLVKSPSVYAPTANAGRALARRKVVLNAMHDNRAIDESTFRSALNEPLRLNDTLRSEEAYGQYFKEEVRKQLVDRFGWEAVYRSGLRVETTLDLDMQRAAETEVAHALESIEQQQRRGSRRVSTEPLQAALVAIDPHTGEVRAMVGGRSFDKSHFNRATQSRRQPGSAFKPFVYAAALEQGYTPATVITGLNDPVAAFRNVWLPDDDHIDGDAITMRAALRLSSNRAAVRMLETVGISEAVDYGARFGLGALPRVPSLALGSGEVTMKSMTAAYGAFDNDGILTAPTLIRRVTTNSGKVVFEAKPEQKPAVAPTTAFLMTSMLQDVVNAGTAAQARSIGFRLPAAGKTGTTNDYHDAWFVGYTPHLVAGVWLGYDQPRTIISNGYAAELAVPLWARFMMSATRTDGPDWFAAPSNITSATVCRISGQLATDGCHAVPTPDDDGNLTIKSMAYTEYFVRGSEPTDYCPLHNGNVLTLATSGSIPQPGAAAPVPPPPSPPVASTAAQNAPANGRTPDHQEPPPKKRGFWGRIFGR
jgi:penicillin-binding protein 1A